MKRVGIVDVVVVFGSDVEVAVGVVVVVVVAVGVVVVVVVAVGVVVVDAGEVVVVVDAGDVDVVVGRVVVGGVPVGLMTRTFRPEGRNPMSGNVRVVTVCVGPSLKL